MEASKYFVKFRCKSLSNVTRLKLSKLCYLLTNLNQEKNYLHQDWGQVKGHLLPKVASCIGDCHLSWLSQKSRCWSCRLQYIASNHVTKVKRSSVVGTIQSYNSTRYCRVGLTVEHSNTNCKKVKNYAIYFVNFKNAI